MKSTSRNMNRHKHPPQLPMGNIDWDNLLELGVLVDALRWFRQYLNQGVVQIAENRWRVTRELSSKLVLTPYNHQLYLLLHDPNNDCTWFSHMNWNACLYRKDTDRLVLTQKPNKDVQGFYLEIDANSKVLSVLDMVSSLHVGAFSWVGDQTGEVQKTTILPIVNM